MSDSSDTDVVVVTTKGPVRGRRRPGSVAFLGIPYAQPPVGDLRFAQPVPPDPWTTEWDATQYGPTAQRRAMQEDSSDAGENAPAMTLIPEPSIAGDGTLNLNVFTPSLDSHGLPVLFWIHGGGYFAGSQASPWYDGASFNRDGVIVVSIGYRLGIEGFLHLPDAPDNRGVLDWIAALEWVRDNIAAFGGDPEKVTIAGQSAGGGAVQTLMVTPSAFGLFRAAISISAGLPQDQSLQRATAVRELFTKVTGQAATAEDLQKLTTRELQPLEGALLAADELPGLKPALKVGPIADGTLVPEPVLAAFRAGRAAPVPLIVGFTESEFVIGSPPQGISLESDPKIG
jgi:para-nitrobenzyl esterase